MVGQNYDRHFPYKFSCDADILLWRTFLSDSTCMPLYTAIQQHRKGHAHVAAVALLPQAFLSQILLIESVKLGSLLLHHQVLVLLKIGSLIDNSYVAYE